MHPRTSRERTRRHPRRLIVGGGQAGPRARVPPGEAGRIVRDPGRVRADRRLHGGRALGFAPPLLTARSRRAAGSGSRRGSSSSHEGSDGATASRDMPVGSSYPVRTEHRRGALSKGGGAYVADAGERGSRRTTVVVATGVMQKPRGSNLRPGARPAHHATPLERLPQPLAASGGARPGGRRESLGCRHRPRGSSPSTRTILSRRGHGPDSRVGRDFGAGGLGFRGARSSSARTS